VYSKVSDSVYVCIDGLYLAPCSRCCIRVRVRVCVSATVCVCVYMHVWAGVCGSVCACIDGLCLVRALLNCV